MSLIMITPSLLLEQYIEIKRELCYFSEMKKKSLCILCQTCFFVFSYLFQVI